MPPFSIAWWFKYSFLLVAACIYVPQPFPPSSSYSFIWWGRVLADIIVILISRFASLSTMVCNCVLLFFCLSPSVPLEKCLISIPCSDKSPSPLSSVPSDTIFSNSFANCSWSELSAYDYTIFSAANMIKHIYYFMYCLAYLGCM